MKRQVGWRPAGECVNDCGLPHFVAKKLLSTPTNSFESLAQNAHNNSLKHILYTVSPVQPPHLAAFTLFTNVKHTFMICPHYIVLYPASAVYMAEMELNAQTE